MSDQPGLFDSVSTKPTSCIECHHANVHDNGRCGYPGCVCGLRDEQLSTQAREEGMGRVAKTSVVSEEWMGLARQAIVDVAQAQRYMSSVDVVELLTKRDQAPPYGSRVMGPLMRRALTEGILEGPVSVKRSDRVTSHRGLENVWESTLFKGEA
jgi:hypothetical protein